MRSRMCETVLALRRTSGNNQAVPIVDSNTPAMRTVLSISSQTVAGVVGNAVTGFVLQCLGHRVWPIPTSLNSNHGGHPHALRKPVDDETVEGLIANLEANGWLEQCDAVFTGHFSSVGQVGIAQAWVSRLKARRPDLIYCCDPVIGDDPAGLYVAEEIAEAIRDQLLPLADIASPNRFELEYLSGSPCSTPDSAAESSKRLGVDTVLASSIPSSEDLVTLCSTAPEIFSRSSPFLGPVPKGTGDLLVALYLGHRLNGHDKARCLNLAVETTFEICRQSAAVEAEELMLIENRNLLMKAT